MKFNIGLALVFVLGFTPVVIAEDTGTGNELLKRTTVMKCQRAVIVRDDPPHPWASLVGMELWVRVGPPQFSEKDRETPLGRKTGAGWYYETPYENNGNAITVEQDAIEFLTRSDKDFTELTELIPLARISEEGTKTSK